MWRNGGSASRRGVVRTSYTEEEIDFLAVYIVPPRKCLRFYPEDEGSLGQYEKYREAWWLMKAEEARVSG
jgi:hypothetical protein